MPKYRIRYQESRYVEVIVEAPDRETVQENWEELAIAETAKCERNDCTERDLLEGEYGDEPWSDGIDEITETEAEKLDAALLAYSEPPTNDEIMMLMAEDRE